MMRCSIACRTMCGARYGTFMVPTVDGRLSSCRVGESSDMLASFGSKASGTTTSGFWAVFFEERFGAGLPIWGLSVPSSSLSSCCEAALEPSKSRIPAPRFTLVLCARSAACETSEPRRRRCPSRDAPCCPPLAPSALDDARLLGTLCQGMGVPSLPTSYTCTNSEGTDTALHLGHETATAWCASPPFSDCSSLFGPTHDSMISSSRAT
mmetsp:Transcript_4849/g.19414  ORF Transcript_4849/g.19414 Transcript_4849/m.19414 type:complete len:209 (+) Transcript_4849:2185-2811(+)